MSGPVVTADTGTDIAKPVGHSTMRRRTHDLTPVAEHSPRSALTTLQISCERKLKRRTELVGFLEFTMRTNQLFPQRSTASFAC